MSILRSDLADSIGNQQDSVYLLRALGALVSIEGEEIHFSFPEHILGVLIIGKISPCGEIKYTYGDSCFFAPWICWAGDLNEFLKYLVEDSEARVHRVQFEYI